MGLDMYLTARKHISEVSYLRKETTEGGTHFTTEPNPEFPKLLESVGLERGDLRTDYPSGTIEVAVAYWRKANAIHQWFVDNCGQGVDDCRPYYVSRASLETLLGVVSEALLTKDTTLLPTQSGFFFGSTEYDEWYWADLESTKEVLTSILTNPKFESTDWAFQYEASW